MMKNLVRELPFGKAIARLTVTMFTEIGKLLTERVITNKEVEIVVDGKVVEKGFFADVLEYNDITDTFFDKAGLDPNKKYTRVGNKAITEGDETGIAIKETLKEMEEELAKEFNTETKEKK